MPINFTQTDSTTGLCTDIVPSLAEVGRIASDGGTAGTTPVTVNVAAQGSTAVTFQCTVAGGVTWAAGTWTIRLNVTTANMFLSINTSAALTKIKRFNSGCTVQETLLSAATGWDNTDIGSTGVKTFTGSASAGSPSAGDVVTVEMIISTSSMSDQTFQFTPDQNIDSPFTIVVPSLVYNPRRHIHQLLVR